MIEGYVSSSFSDFRFTVHTGDDDGNVDNNYYYSSNNYNSINNSCMMGASQMLHLWDCSKR